MRTFRFLPVTAVCLSLIGVARVQGHSANEPAPRPDDWWKQRHESMNTQVKNLGEKAQVIFIGDSITQGWEGAGRDVWAARYASRNAINLGIGGDRTQHVLWRLDNGNLEGLKPKAAVVMIGTNNSNGEDNTVEQIADGITAIVQKLRVRLPETRVLLIPIFPRSENPSPQRGKVLQVNQIVQKLADGKHVVWVDFGHRFVDSDGTIPRDLMPDFLHLSPKAYGIWADSIEADLVAALGGGTPATGGVDLTGEWVATMPGPGGDPVKMPFSLKQDGTTLTGRFARPDGGWLEMRDGKVEGGKFSWTIKRNRPDGGDMIYQMSGKVDGGKLAGSTKTEMAGAPITLEWTGERK
ncbi:MAG: GDSL-type esterase/lipase family protein [Limisphaerales bacterium]